MADALVLGEPKKLTMNSTIGHVLEVSVPAGTKYLRIQTDPDGSDENIGLEFSGTDNTAGDADARETYFGPKGIYTRRMPGSREQSGALRTATNVYFSGSVASQDIWVTASPEGV